MDFADLLVAIGVPMYWVGGLMFIVGLGMVLFKAFVAKNKEEMKKRGVLMMVVGGGLCIVAVIITAIGGDPFPG